MRFLALAASDDAWFAALSPDEAAAASAAEARRLWELYLAGLVVDVRWRTDRRDVVLLLDASDEGAARSALASLPFVAAGGVTFEVIGLRPYDGWARLFRPPPPA
jgi:hypothetical protein